MHCERIVHISRSLISDIDGKYFEWVLSMTDVQNITLIYLIFVLFGEGKPDE